MIISRGIRISMFPALLAACTMQRWQPAQTSSLDDHMSHMSTADMAAPAVSSGTRSDTPSQGTPGIPAGAQDAEARLKASNRHAEWVKIPWAPGSRDSLMAWVVYPASTKKAPVVVVIHEIFGLSTWVRGVADQLAADGFIAVAPDLLSRVRGAPSATELPADSARKLISGVQSSEINAGVLAAAAYGMSLPAAERKYGVIGYCWGGNASFGYAVSGGTGLRGTVVYYGMAPWDKNRQQPVRDSLIKIAVPILAFYGGTDARIGATVPATDSAMKALKKSYVYRSFEGADHGFLRAQEKPANLDAAKQAWPLTIAFFRQQLTTK